MCSNTMLKERELQRKRGINERAHLLVVTFFARWQQHLGTGKEGVHRQAQLLLADLVVVCVCPFLQRGRKRKEVRDQGWFLVFFYLESKHFGLDPAPSETKHKPHWLQEAPGQVTGTFQASSKLQLSLGDCMYQRKCLQKLLEENGSRGKGFHSQNWAVVGEQGDGKMAKEAEMCNHTMCNPLFLRKSSRNALWLAVGERRWYIANVCNSCDSVPEYHKNQK